MTTPAARRIDELEVEIEQNPESRELREEILGWYASAELPNDPRRTKHVLWIVQRYPCSAFARCPLAQVVNGAQGRPEIEAEWERHHAEQPDDASIAQGFACFVAHSERQRAVAILETFVLIHPEAAEVWMEMGRLHPAAPQRLAFLQQARRLGSTQPNLLVWIARNALEADDYTCAHQTGLELLAEVEAARKAHGPRLDWYESGRELYERARQVSSDRDSASQLVHAIGKHAHDKHWAHTVLGMVALRAADDVQAIYHLRQSADVRREPRLSSYGPSFALAARLCEHGAWEAVADYLRACEAFWNPDVLRELRSEVEKGNKPAFPGR